MIQLKYRVDIDKGDVVSLEIVEDIPSGGFFLFTYEKDTSWDDWFERKETAFDVAEERFGIKKSDWAKISD